jgi:hypothetical protein
MFAFCLRVGRAILPAAAFQAVTANPVNYPSNQMPADTTELQKHLRPTRESSGRMANPASGAAPNGD